MYIKTLKNILQTNGRITKSKDHILKPINYKHNTKTRKVNPHIKYYDLSLTTPARKNNYTHSRISIANYATPVVKYRDIKTWI